MSTTAMPASSPSQSLTASQIEQIVLQKRNIPASKILNIYTFGSRLYGSHLVPRPALLSKYMSQMTHIYQYCSYYALSGATGNDADKLQSKTLAMASKASIADFDIYIVVDYDSECKQLLDNTLDSYQLKLPSNVFSSTINPITRLVVNGDLTSSNNNNNLTADQVPLLSESSNILGVDITFRTREEFYRDVAKHEEIVLLFLSLQKHPQAFASQFILKETEKPTVEFPIFSLQSDKWANDYERRKELYMYFKECSEISFERARKQLSTRKQGLYNALKNYFHGIRNLHFKLQLVQNGYISNFAAANEILQEMYSEFDQIATKLQFAKCQDYKNLMTSVYYEQVSIALSKHFEDKYVKGKAQDMLRDLRIEMQLL